MPKADLHVVPSELRSCPQWVVWRYEHRAGKATKVPYSPTTGGRASSTDPTHWAEFEVACEAATGSFEGVGFVFSGSDPFCGVDLDDCLDGVGQTSPDARRIVDHLNTYTEISPSGRGLKLFLRAELPPGRRRRGSVEMYDRGRYFTVTGRHLPGSPLSVEDRQQELATLHAELFPPPPQRRSGPTRPIHPTEDDATLLARARSAKNGHKFMRLFYTGDLADYGGDDSAADLALCGLLSFWCGPDAARIDRLFRQSALMRTKWDSRRGATTYGALTIAKALGVPRG